MNEFDVLTDYGLDALSAVVHTNAMEKGFWDGDFTYDKVGSKLALVHSEVTEVLEGVRKNKGSSAIVEEVADIIIRTLDVYAAMRDNGVVDDSLDELLQKKIDINKERPKLHGNLF